MHARSLAQHSYLDRIYFDQIDPLLFVNCKVSSVWVAMVETHIDLRCIIRTDLSIFGKYFRTVFFVVFHCHSSSVERESLFCTVKN